MKGQGKDPKQSSFGNEGRNAIYQLPKLLSDPIAVDSPIHGIKGETRSLTR